MRSEAASAPPKAQQQPQFDWSRMSPMVLAQAGQLVAESNAAGGAARVGRGTYSSISPMRIESRSWRRGRGEV